MHRKNDLPHNNPDKPFLGPPHLTINGFYRPDTEPGTAFTQTSPVTGGSISPDQLFSFFTYEVILERKVFVR
jgi:hypothetical protein